jgi:RHS repeat-associated protein
MERAGAAGRELLLRHPRRQRLHANQHLGPPERRGLHAQGVSGYPQPDFAYEYNYNQAGHVIGNRVLATQGSSHVDLKGQYAWDNQSRMTSMTYPSGPVMTTQFDAMGRPSNMSETACVVTPGNPQCSNYTWTAGNATYGSAGQLLTVGGSGFNGTITASVNETRTYNNMLQLIHLTSGTQSFQSPNTYNGGGVDMQYIYNTGHNNGRVAETIDNVLGETVNYSYDYLHRLTAATATNGTWGEAYTYDGFGNLTGKTPTQGYAPAMTGSADSNATVGALNGQWDVEKRPMTQSTSFYVYDPWGRRIWKQWYDTTYGTTNCEAYFYGATGQKLESYSCTYSATSLGATLEGINTYFAGKMLSEKGVFIATDRLGSVRGDSNGVTMSYYPWGEERGQGTTDNRTKFAGYYRDMPGQDYAMARYYSASSGSFWSPDPGGMKNANSGNPLTWNRFSYVMGDPINRTDHRGLCSDQDDPPCFSAEGDAPLPGDGGDTNNGQLSEESNDAQSGNSGGNPYAALQAVANSIAGLAASVIDKGCDGLFGSDAKAGDQLREAVTDGKIFVAPFGTNINANVGAQYNSDTGQIQIASNRYFFTGILANGSSVLNTVDFSGLNMQQMQETIIIHEFMHLEGFVGADNKGQTITLPNGQTVVGSTGLTQAIKQDCFGVK